MIVYKPIIQNLEIADHVTLDFLRLDLVDDKFGGNKWFKLKHNLEKAKAEGFTKIVTFGGAFSNHIAATAAACQQFGFESLGIIRGEQSEGLNQTLKYAMANKMQLHFVSREQYSQKDQPSFKDRLTDTFGKHYLIPEGGNNMEGVLGSMEILNEHMDHDYVFCACGTGTTYAGLLASAKPEQTLVGISVLKGKNLLVSDVNKLMSELFPTTKTEVLGNKALDNPIIKNNCIIDTYCFKGYASYEEELIKFKENFEINYKIPLDYIYTTKLVFAIFDLIQKQKLKKGAKILMIHTGGLQGNTGFQNRYHLKPIL